MIKTSNHHKRNYYGQCAGPRLVINYGQNTFLNCLEIFCKQTNLLNESYKKRKKKSNRNYESYLSYWHINRTAQRNYD